MSTAKPFLFGGIASLTAEVGKRSISIFVVELESVFVGCWSVISKQLVYPSSLSPLGTFPLDTTKTRLQVQGQHMDVLCHSSRYRGMVHALFRISQEEGFVSLYKG